MSPPFDIAPFPEYCFSMWYLMFGRHTFRKKFDKTYILYINDILYNIFQPYSMITLVDIEINFVKLARIYFYPQHPVREGNDFKRIWFSLSNCSSLALPSSDD